MFHHFHGGSHPKAQGSIDAAKLEQVLDFVMQSHHVLPANIWLERAKNGSLSNQDVCVTFDDALACQYDIALPVLNERGLTAFWFVYTSVLEGGCEPLEIFRLFRTTRFSDIDLFYDQFFTLVRDRFQSRYLSSENQFDPTTYLENAPFYSNNDKWFRYLRDNTLSFEEYKAVMHQMMDDADFSIEEARQNLWLNVDQVRNLADHGHVVGLHSHTHPTAIAKLSETEQSREYKLNSDALHRILGTRPETVSHPCNSYSEQTLDVLRSLGARIGFRADTRAIDLRSPLEFAREDHANICKALRDEGRNYVSATAGAIL
jgi:peptidoglycan/xylan/chitin deacetylase (PgdA/CDA1 family)